MHLIILQPLLTIPTSARFTSRQRVRFVSLPPDLNTNAQNNESWAINAALVAGLFPKLLIVEKGKMQTLGNNQPVAFHPSSVNFRKRPEDLVGGGMCLMYFTLMYVRLGLRDVVKCELTLSISRHSKKLYVWETSPVNDHALLLLCGDVEFKVRLLSLLQVNTDKPPHISPRLARSSSIASSSSKSTPRQCWHSKLSGPTSPLHCMFA